MLAYCATVLSTRGSGFEPIDEPIRADLFSVPPVLGRALRGGSGCVLPGPTWAVSPRPSSLLTPVDTGGPTSGIPNNHRTLSPNMTYFVLGQGEDTNHKSPTFVPVGPVLIRSPVAVRNG